MSGGRLKLLIFRGWGGDVGYTRHPSAEKSVSAVPLFSQCIVGCNLFALACSDMALLTGKDIHATCLCCYRLKCCSLWHAPVVGIALRRQRSASVN